MHNFRLREICQTYNLKTVVTANVYRMFLTEFIDVVLSNIGPVINYCVAFKNSYNILIFCYCIDVRNLH
jgi:hypothetical protein